VNADRYDVQMTNTLRTAVLGAVLLLAGVGGCSDTPTGPTPPGPGILYPGIVARGTMSTAADTAHYLLVPDQAKDAIIYLIAKGPAIQLEVRDSTGRVITGIADQQNVTEQMRRSTAVIPASLHNYRVDVRLINGDGPGDYEIRVAESSRAPEHVPAKITVGQIVTGEDLDHPQDVDSFTVTVQQRELLHMYLRKTTHDSATVRAYLITPGDPLFLDANVGAAPGDTVLGATASERFWLDPGVQHTILVFSSTSDTLKAGYELELERIDTLPEMAPVALVVGDTVHESIDYLGDIDDFTLAGPPGARYNVFADAGGTTVRAVLVTVKGSGPVTPNVTASPGIPLAQQGTGAFTMPSSGAVTVNVQDWVAYLRGRTGPYRIFVYPVNSAPEAVSADIALDTPASDAIDMLGDEDVFRFALAQDTTIAIDLQLAPTISGSQLVIDVRDSADSMVTSMFLGPDPTRTQTSGMLRLKAGHYTIRVAGYSSSYGGFVGGYTLLARTTAASPVAPTARLRATAPRSPSPSPTSSPTGR
jgi:hypothetical protein